jgi:hypothetical protein
MVDVAVTSGRGALAWTGSGTPRRIEIDPERVYLDPLAANNVWRRR